jgi:hypothetical protein
VEQQASVAIINNLAAFLSNILAKSIIFSFCIPGPGYPISVGAIYLHEQSAHQLENTYFTTKPFLLDKKFFDLKNV